MEKTVLITWGTWYIGSHAVVDFLELWYKVVVVDNLSNSTKDVLKRIKRITNKTVKFYEIDLNNKKELKEVFHFNKIDLVIHFAWLKAVWESTEKPFLYYKNNIIWSMNLFELMEEFDVKDIIFSSSATVYDQNEKSPLTEEKRLWTINPYWTTKLTIENILKDLANHKWFRVIALRYFNPIWAHKTSLIWEEPNWVPNNLLPYIIKVIMWELKELQVFWDNYNTPDWTGVRDYIHISDLIRWHIKAYEYLERQNPNWFFDAINLWTGLWTSVLQMINFTKEVTDLDVPYKIAPKRKWDLDKIYCDPTKALIKLNWKTKYSVKEWIKDSYDYARLKNKL